MDDNTLEMVYRTIYQQEFENETTRSTRRMKASLIKKELAKAIKYSGKCFCACGEIASEFQPYFEQEINVFEQSGDGFVIEFESNDGLAPHNIPVLEALEVLKKDPNAYR